MAKASSKSSQAAVFGAPLERLAGPLWPELQPLVQARHGMSTMQIRVGYAKAGRLAGTSRLDLSPAELAALGVPAPLEGWCADELARGAVLLGAVELLTNESQLSLVETLYRTGSEREQRSLLHLLALLPEAQRFADLAAEAARTNTVNVFAALACENPFPGVHLPDLNFNQLVLKAIFLELDTHRIIGLEQRVTTELVRMLKDYENERRAAGRSVPEDISRIAQLLRPS